MATGLEKQQQARQDDDSLARCTVEIDYTPNFDQIFSTRSTLSTTPPAFLPTPSPVTHSTGSSTAAPSGAATTTTTTTANRPPQNMSTGPNWSGQPLELQRDSFDNLAQAAIIRNSNNQLPTSGPPINMEPRSTGHETLSALLSNQASSDHPAVNQTTQTPRPIQYTNTQYPMPHISPPSISPLSTNQNTLYQQQVPPMGDSSLSSNETTNLCNQAYYGLENSSPNPILDPTMIIQNTSPQPTLIPNRTIYNPDTRPIRYRPIQSVANLQMPMRANLCIFRPNPTQINQQATQVYQQFSGPRLQPQQNLPPQQQQQFQTNQQQHTINHQPQQQSISLQQQPLQAHLQNSNQLVYFNIHQQMNNQPNVNPQHYNHRAPLNATQYQGGNSLPNQGCRMNGQTYISQQSVINPSQSINYSANRCEKNQGRPKARSRARNNQQSMPQCLNQTIIPPFDATLLDQVAGTYQTSVLSSTISAGNHGENIQPPVSVSSTTLPPNDLHRQSVEIQAVPEFSNKACQFDAQPISMVSKSLSATVAMADAFCQTENNIAISSPTQKTYVDRACSPIQFPPTNVPFRQKVTAKRRLPETKAPEPEKNSSDSEIDVIE